MIKFCVLFVSKKNLFFQNFSFFFIFLLFFFYHLFLLSFLFCDREREFGFRIQFCSSFRVCQTNPKSLALSPPSPISFLSHHHRSVSPSLPAPSLPPPFKVFFLSDWVQQRYVEQTRAVVDVPVIMQLPFQQFRLFLDVQVPQIQLKSSRFAVVQQRRVPTVHTVQETQRSHRCRSWRRLFRSRCCERQPTDQTVQNTVEVRSCRSSTRLSTSLVSALDVVRTTGCDNFPEQPLFGTEHGSDYLCVANSWAALRLFGGPLPCCSREGPQECAKRSVPFVVLTATCVSQLEHGFCSSFGSLHTDTWPEAPVIRARVGWPDARDLSRGVCIQN